MSRRLEGRSRRGKHGVRPQQTEQVEVWILPSPLNLQIRQYFDNVPVATDGRSWLHYPEVPSSAEVMDIDTSSGSSSGIVELVPNKPKGAWASKEAYLSAQYDLAREDALKPIREAVCLVRESPNEDEENEAFKGAIGIYEKAHVCALTYSTRGIAIKMTFSLARARKKIIWEQSKRLISGGLVVLTPKKDMFNTTAIVATVASRSLPGLLKDPPELDLFVARAEELFIDPAEEWVMVENRSSYFEASRHTLLGLQKMMQESFPLQEHLVGAKMAVPPPKYVVQHPVMDLTAVLHESEQERVDKVNVLENWPARPSSELDASQLAALHRALTKQLAIVQGPPGTGKTHVSVQAVKVFLDNWRDGDPPIIIACQTNHAVDQILRHIANFTSEFIRLGGRSKDRDVIQKRTLYAVRTETSERPPPGCLLSGSHRVMKALEKEMETILRPLEPCRDPIDPDILVHYGLLNAEQATSLRTGASKWVQSNQSDPNEARNPFILWLGGTLVSVPIRQPPDTSTSEFVYEAAELEIEQLREVEAENVAKDDEDFDNLYGETRPLADNFTCRKSHGSSTTTHKIQDALRHNDMWKIPAPMRGAVFRHLQSGMKRRILNVLRPKVKEYDEQARRRRIGAFERDEVHLKQQKIIGMTTTGLSKYRALLAALSPKIVLIEEAAETLEAPVAVACLPTVQQLILVGDHKQLRPHCQVNALERKPFYLDISLFERLINNDVEYTTLVKQRRMIPEIRRLLYPIYKDLITDHAYVLDKANRPDVPGMGGVNSFWYTHTYTERRDAQMSMVNPEEAEMVVGMVEYLCYNGMDPNEITILTFYNGQRQELLRTLRKRASLIGRRFNVVTVDSYQGEENKVVLLSLVRSNLQGAIGFLGIDNRICVALSRAQCGFYIFGNAELLHKTKTWRTVIQTMARKGPPQALPRLEDNRLGCTLVVTCTNHGRAVPINGPSDWEKITGGCEKICGARLACGHICPVTCHPVSHDLIGCQQPCAKLLSCGHPCQRTCSEACSCNVCLNEVDQILEYASIGEHDDSGAEAKSCSTASSWRSFASEESERYAIAASAPAPKITGIENMMAGENTATAGPPNVKSSTVGLEQRLVQRSNGSAITDHSHVDAARAIGMETALPPASASSASASPASASSTSAEDDEADLIQFRDWSRAASLLD